MATTAWVECPNHGGAFDCTPFCPLCEGLQEHPIAGDEGNYIYPASREALAFSKSYADYIETSVAMKVAKGRYDHDWAMSASLGTLLIGNDGN